MENTDGFEEWAVRTPTTLQVLNFLSCSFSVWFFLGWQGEEIWVLVLPGTRKVRCRFIGYTCESAC